MKTKNEGGPIAVLEDGAAGTTAQNATQPVPSSELQGEWVSDKEWHGEPRPLIGWKLVPIEPTEEMVRAAHAATAGWLGLPGPHSALSQALFKHAHRWRAMVAAAPNPPIGALSRPDNEPADKPASMRVEGIKR